jgi:hypothetical protein
VSTEVANSLLQQHLIGEFSNCSENLNVYPPPHTEQGILNMILKFTPTIPHILLKYYIISQEKIISLHNGEILKLLHTQTGQIPRLLTKL